MTIGNSYDIISTLIFQILLLKSRLQGKISRFSLNLSTMTFSLQRQYYIDADSPNVIVKSCLHGKISRFSLNLSTMTFSLQERHNVVVILFCSQKSFGAYFHTFQ